MTRYLGIDLGTKTLGLALSDIGGRFASPLKVIKRGKWAEDRASLQAILQENKVATVVVGLPLQMDGTHGEAASRVGAFADLLKKDLAVKVVTWDERLSTVAAENAMFEQRTGRQTRASRKDVKAQGVDAVAAALILQGYLESLENT